MGKVCVDKPGLQRLNAALRLVQRPPRHAMSVALGFQRRIQFGDTHLECSDGIIIATAIQDHDGHATILHKAVPRPGLVGALLRRCAGRALEAQRTPHSSLGGLTVIRRQGEVFV